MFVGTFFGSLWKILSNHFMFEEFNMFEHVWTCLQRNMVNIMVKWTQWIPTRWERWNNNTKGYPMRKWDIAHPPTENCLLFLDNTQIIIQLIVLKTVSQLDQIIYRSGLYLDYNQVWMLRWFRMNRWMNETQWLISCFFFFRNIRTIVKE